jgi:hypothetical protein
MRLLQVDVCPIWEEDDGSRTVGMHERPNHPDVVGWCAVSTIKLSGETYTVLLNLEAFKDALDEDD